MRKFPILFFCILRIATVYAQDNSRFGEVFRRLEADSQMKYGISAFCLADSRTGEIIFEKNSRIGLSPASAQKVIVAAAAFELLGATYRYQTDFYHTGTIRDHRLDGDLLVAGSGDPTLGSTRFANTKPEAIRTALLRELNRLGIDSISGNWYELPAKKDVTWIPGGWTWEDIGNYYGAGAGALNWNENQYDLVLEPGKREGDPVKVSRTEPQVGYSFLNQLSTGKAGSGDQAYLYFVPGREHVLITGTVPCCLSTFRVSGAAMDPGKFTLKQLISITGRGRRPGETFTGSSDIGLVKWHTHWSAPLDSIVYWFLRKSINLYGEALVITLGRLKKNSATTDSGLAVVQSFWQTKGIPVDALHMQDGSGLSPANRVTAEALTRVMLFARNRPWFPSFYAALPEINGIKMKSGTIGGVKSYTGYLENKSGKKYTFAIMVNNYSGPASNINRKILEVLDASRW
jgi:D-alanyl-D-alanine carboxypeptidase/D-alanyl-D-alanine-endopeptidase (penicillin-binding protein 4)